MQLKSIFGKGFPVGFITCDSEDTEDFSFVLNSIKLFDPSITPEFLLADGAEAITNGFKVNLI